MAKSVAMAACAVLLIVGFLSLDSSTATAANFGQYRTVGWVYGVPSLKGWKDGWPKGRDGQAKYDTGTIDATHYVYEKSTDPMADALNMQKAINRALDDGWTIVGMDAGRVLISHPSRPLWDEGRK